ncbi:MAG: hypothetical protein ACLT5P_08180 [Flavonifractor plautii]
MTDAPPAGFHRPEGAGAGPAGLLRQGHCQLGQREEESLSAILPLVKKYGAAVVGLTLDQGGIPKSAQARVEVARRILERALALGIRREDVYIDCLTLTVSAEQEGAAQTLTALRRVKEELGLKTVLGCQHPWPARPALVNQNSRYGHGGGAGPAHPQPQCGYHDGSAVLSPADCVDRRPGVHRRPWNAVVTTAISGGGAALTAAARTGAGGGGGGRPEGGGRRRGPDPAGDPGAHGCGGSHPDPRSGQGGGRL